MEGEKRRYTRRWMITLLYTLFIFAFLPIFPNVILLTVDTLRPDHRSCYGYARDTTPFLDKLAKKGVIFKNVISSAPWTSPGVISIFTGLYPTEHGVQGTRKVFGPLPREAWEPLPYWNPYRIRISPYGLKEYWSHWVEFTIIKE